MAATAGGSAAVPAVCLAALSLAACGREERFVRDHITAMPGVTRVDAASCDDAVPNDGVCATVVMSDGAVLRFAGLKFDSFGPVPSRVGLVEAGGRSPLIVSCDALVAVADVDRAGLFGHHFSPALGGVTDAIRRHRDVVEELEFWPECPQFWELPQEPGPRFRYCAHRAGAAPELPPPFCGS